LLGNTNTSSPISWWRRPAASRRQKSFFHALLFN
jgi:hypothetical protein